MTEKVKAAVCSGGPTTRREVDFPPENTAPAFRMSRPLRPPRLRCPRCGFRFQAPRSFEEGDALSCPYPTCRLIVKPGWEPLDESWARWTTGAAPGGGR